MEITEFLNARLDEDEAVARGADGELEPWDVSDAGNVTAYDKRLIASVWIQNARHIARFDPARMLADVTAKRAILALHPNVNDGDCGLCAHGPVFGGRNPSVWPCETVLALAQPYAGHPDFSPRWRP